MLGEEHDMFKKLATGAALSLAAMSLAAGTASAKTLASQDVVYETNEVHASVTVQQVRVDISRARRYELLVTFRVDSDRDGVLDTTEVQHLDYARDGFRILGFTADPEHNQADIDLRWKRKNVK